ncbi:rhamnulokinase [Halanaerobium salsuginis]|uniref:Rhamnulokinase n=1 Tax=Halanaerobium salsuginis TaxID=29563 RepID=A0A1I4JXH1_9FIRM|nr:rhamnulokinase [Halanaerobium salsuginis]SFL71269.1 L-rhamnulokinase [Halanaerobium salsuginis]
MQSRALAVDIGASSGRLISGLLKENILELSEIHRFDNQIIKKEDAAGLKEDCWDLAKLYREILVGLEKSKANSVAAESIGIDTWAVDFVLLDQKEEIVGQPVAYRSARTNGQMEKVFKLIPQADLYQKTGIQFLQINTIYQLAVLKEKFPEQLAKAVSFLMIPDYFNYLLTGQKTNEYTNASTTQLINVKSKTWDQEILNKLGIKKSIFEEPIAAGKSLGKLKAKLRQKLELAELQVIAPATHDTGSAIAAVPTNSKDYAYISSGTWSLMGIETDSAICSENALKYNFTNEGGVYGTNRFLKNIMGLWLIQEVKKELNNKYSFAELVSLAKKTPAFRSLINPNDNSFLNPPSMIQAIQEYCSNSQQPVPEQPGELARCIFESLACQYKQVLLELNEVADQKITKLHIIGGGVQNEFLNQLTANITGLEVYAGPIEATAIGNLIVQYITLGRLSSLAEAREIVSNSFTIKHYQPADLSGNNAAGWQKFLTLQI